MSEHEPEKGNENEPEKGEEIEQPEKGSSQRDDVSYWRDQADKWEKRAKQNHSASRELEQLRKQHMSDSEKAIAEAREDERANVRREYAVRLVDAELRHASSGRNVDADALIEGIDRARFLNDDFEPDRDAIIAWLDRVAPVPQENDEPSPEYAPILDLGQGSRGSVPLNGDPLEKMIKSQLGIR